MKRIPLHLSLLLLFPVLLMARQQPPKAGLLWRISGNGLTKPSWLYGTIHLTDKRVFNFSDSLYAALEKSEGYAMELHPDSIMSRQFGKGEERVLLKDSLKAKDFERLKKKLKAAYNKPPEEVTVEEFKSHFRSWVNRGEANGMHTIMDAWFYNVARMQGKWLGGIEDVEDQAGITEGNPLSFYVEDFMNDHRGSIQTVEKMIKVYQAEDIEAIGSKMFHEAEDTMMIRRNRKMARRMDSLARLRSLFFAVGAGHLPGDSGVVNLLRRRGFTVEQVVTASRTHATNYRFAEKEMPWIPVRANNGLYTIQLPGEPQDTKLDVGNLDLKMYMDLGSNMFYMAMGGGKATSNEDSLMTQAVRRMNAKATVTESRTITYDNIRGKEIVAKAKDAHYRVRMFFMPEAVVLVMVGSQIDTVIHSANAERFFQSLVIDKEFKATSLAWNNYSYPDKGFSMRIPGEVSVKVEPMEDSSMLTTKYASLDIANNMYFQVLVQDMQKGYYLTGDTTGFGSYRDRIRFDTTFHMRDMQPDSLQHYPGMRLSYTVESEGTTYHNTSLNLHRGNRVYYLIVTAGDSAKGREAANSFFSSFSFIPTKENTWSQQTAPDGSFTMWSPAPVGKYKYKEATAGTDPLFEQYDAAAPITYYIRKNTLPAYYWAASDTAFLHSIAANVNRGDSLGRYALVNNGPYKGAEYTVHMTDNHNVKNIRLLIVGDTLYYIYAVGAQEFFDRPNSRRLFTDFTVNHQTTSTLFTNKAKKLFEALQSPDSLVFAEAKRSLELIIFRKEELPMLHQAMLQWYRDSADYTNATNKLFEIVETLKDSSSIDFVKKVWNGLPAHKEEMRYDLLCIVASHKTAETFSLTKDLLLQHPPQKGTGYRLYAILRDSMELLAPLWPELLPLLKDSVASWDIISLTEHLLDDSLVDRKLLTPYKKDLYTMAVRGLKGLKDPEADNQYQYHALVRVLAGLKDPVATQWVRKFLLQSDLNLKQTAAFALLKNGQPVEATEWLKLAADKELRIDVYEQLVEMKKERLFPAQYLTEKAFGESELYSYASDENDVKKMTFIGERIATWKGQRKKFYLYRIDMSYEDEKIIHLGIAGPYGLKPGKPLTEAGATGINWNEEYDAAQIDKQLKAFLKQMEEYE